MNSGVKKLKDGVNWCRRKSHLMRNWTQVVKGFLNVFLKPNCPLCDRPTDEILCKACDRQLQRQKFTNPRQFWTEKPPLLPWGSYGGTLKRAIAAMKYENHPQLATPLGHALAETWLNSPIPAPPKLTVVPIPMHPEKQKKRGFNQAELLAKSFCDLTGYRLEAGGLERMRDTEALFGLSPSQREKTLANAINLGVAFRRRPPANPVLLIDDIYTTGTTCREAAKVLQKHGIKLYGIAAIATTKKGKG